MERVAVVTGGTRGIGHAIVARLVKDGFKVAAIYAGNEEAAQKVRDEFGIMAVKADVGDYEASQKAIFAIEADLGPISVLVNNAGITRDGALHKMTPQQWHEVIRADLDSVFIMSRLVIEGMRERGYGRIINISSINGQKGQFGQTNYSAAKAGMIGFTKALALESAKKGITVNAVAPGYIGTEMVAAVPEEVLKGIISGIPVGRLGAASEIADAVAYLANEKSGFITGAVLSVNGGQYMVG